MFHVQISKNRMQHIVYNSGCCECSIKPNRLWSLLFLKISREVFIWSLKQEHLSGSVTACKNMHGYALYGDCEHLVTVMENVEWKVCAFNGVEGTRWMSDAKYEIRNVSQIFFSIHPPLKAEMLMHIHLWLKWSDEHMSQQNFQNQVIRHDLRPPTKPTKENRKIHTAGAKEKQGDRRKNEGGGDMPVLNVCLCSHNMLLITHKLFNWYSLSKRENLFSS